MEGFKSLRQEIFKKIKHVRRKIKGKRVAIQLPDGLQIYALDILGFLENIGAKGFLLVDQSFGACDVFDEEAKKINADILLHFGHEFIYKPKINTIFIPLKYDKVYNEKFLRMLKTKLKGKVGVVGSVQYEKAVKQIREFLEKEGFDLIENRPRGRIKKNAQVLGCNYSATEGADSVVLVADGYFHGLGAMYSQKRKQKIFITNPFDENLEMLSQDREKWVKKRISLVLEAKERKKFGFMVSLKQGQNRLRYAEELKKIMEKKGYKVYLFVGNTFYPESVRYYPVDVLVNFACPRIATDDSQNYKGKIVLTAKELEMMLENKFDEYVFDSLA